MAGGPLRAAWQRRDGSSPGWGALVPALLSLTYMMSDLTFFTNYAHPVIYSRADQVVTLILVFTHNASHSESSLVEVVGVVSILLQSAILMGVVLLAIRRWRLPVGAFALMFALNGLLMAVLSQNTPWLSYVLTVVLLYALVGLAADLLNLWLKPSAERVGALRLFAFDVPFFFCAVYFLAILALHGEIAWSVHVWTGTVFLAGFVGLFLSYLLVPMRLPSGEGV